MACGTAAPVVRPAGKELLLDKGEGNVPFGPEEAPAQKGLRYLCENLRGEKHALAMPDACYGLVRARGCGGVGGVQTTATRDLTTHNLDLFCVSDGGHACHRPGGPHHCCGCTSTHLFLSRSAPLSGAGRQGPQEASVAGRQGPQEASVAGPQEASVAGPSDGALWTAPHQRTNVSK